ncbi:MAG: hypothetical protein V4689_16290 [Verrucomicrobiota bacterium]
MPPPGVNGRMHLIRFASLSAAFLTSASAAWIWVEGEAPSADRMNRHPWWYDQVKKDQFSGGDFISNFDKEKAGEAGYRFTAKQAGDYEFWVRANPFETKLSYALNGGADTAMDLTSGKRGESNVAADGKPDLRFLAWSKIGKATLRSGENTIRFRMTSANSNHGYLDCFVFSSEPFLPTGTTKPDQIASETAKDRDGWFAFDPKPDPFANNSATDLRFLNEKFAGENGFIGVKDGNFIHTTTGKPVRFWAVNGPPADLKGFPLRECARLLAKYGVNLIRIHSGYFDSNGEVDPAKVLHAIEVVEAMKAEGIYTHFSIYFPLWLDPKPGNRWLAGYNGSQHSFASLMFNPDFQAQYRKWWTALLTTPSPATGKRLIDEPAVASLEMQNEDSLFFWTFSDTTIPDAQLRMLEKQFGGWLAARNGSLEKAVAAWKSEPLKRDALAEGRIAFRPLWNIFTDRTPRDRETAEFLLEVQTRFYTETRAFLKKLGFKGPITASNWATASPEILGPLEKLSYTTGDFIDHHGYFENNHKGDQAEWSVREGHTWSDRSALRFDPEAPGKPKQFFHPAMDPHYDGLPSMISETTWCRPNRFRGEAPLYYAAYGALQHTNAIVWFALDGARWSVKPGFFEQPWTVMTPAIMGQFPAAALIYRRGLIQPGKVVAEVALNRDDLLQLKGTPLPQDAGLDELRLKDIPNGVTVKPGQRLNPLLHFIGRSDVRFVTTPGSTKAADLTPYLDADTIRSSTGELKLDHTRGFLTIDAPQAQGAAGRLKSVETSDLAITSDMDPGYIIVASLDNQPLATSKRMLLQVMSEEKESGFQSEPVSSGVRRITALGADPWLVGNLSGKVRFKRPDAARLRVTPLDFNGYPLTPADHDREIPLQPGTLYYLIEAR